MGLEDKAGLVDLLLEGGLDVADGDVEDAPLFCQVTGQLPLYNICTSKGRTPL